VQILKEHFLNITELHGSNYEHIILTGLHISYWIAININILSLTKTYAV
jgi:hypothetical protein